MSLFDKLNDSTKINIDDDATCIDELIRIYLLDDGNYMSESESSKHQKEASEEDEIQPSRVSLLQQHQNLCTATVNEQIVSSAPRAVSPISHVTNSTSSTFEICYEDDNDTVVSDLTNDSEHERYYDSLPFSFVQFDERPSLSVKNPLSHLEAKIQETSNKLKKRLLRSDETRQMLKRQRISERYLCDSSSQRNSALTEFTRTQLLHVL
jgi:hypothetical protein